MFFKDRRQENSSTENQKQEEIKSLLPVTLELADISKAIYMSSKDLNDCSHALSHITGEVESNVHINQNMMKQVNKEVDLISISAENIHSNARRNEELSNENLKNVAFSMDALKESINKIEDVFNYFDAVEKIMEKLKIYSDSIGNITTYIDQIASKTSLVSINASIEAARAGEAGRGFMVITDEIKNLANQSKEFSNNISGMIADMTDCIDELNQISKSNCEKVTQTKQSVSKLEENLDSITQSTSELDRNIQETLTSSHEIKKSVESGSETVAKLMDSFNGIIENSDSMSEAVKVQNGVAGKLTAINEKVISISEEQLNIVLDSKIEEKLIIIGKRVAQYEGPRDGESLREFAKEHFLHSFNYINDEGYFEAAANEKAIGFNIFESEPEYRKFKTSSEQIRVYPLSRNLFTGDIIRYVAAKQVRTKQLISMGLNLEALRKISEMTVEEIEKL